MDDLEGTKLKKPEKILVYSMLITRDFASLNSIEELYFDSCRLTQISPPAYLG